MNINRASSVSFYRDFYAIDIKENGQVDVTVKTLNIFERFLRYLIGAYSNTIWTSSKSLALKGSNPRAWKQIEQSIVDAKIFAKIFKVENTRIFPVERLATQSRSLLQQFVRTQLQQQLQELKLEFREAVENGDCLFDAVAYLLTKERGDKQYTAQEVRAEIARYVQSDKTQEARYKKLHKSNPLAPSYEGYCQNIGTSAADVATPIWGDELALQIIADLYGVTIKVQSSTVLETTILETLEGGQFEDFPYILSENNVALVCTKLNSKVYNPIKSNVEEALSFTLAHIADDTRGHFFPVVEK